MLKKLLILLLIPFILCACEKKTKEEITFSSWGSVTEVRIINKIISDFEHENPDIKVNFLHIPQNYFQKIHLLFASSQAPDVIFINNLYLPVYASRLEDLSNFAAKNSYYPESLRALSYNGRLLAIPRDVSTLVFYRNRDLISTTPVNLDEFMQVLKSAPEYGVSYERNVYYMFPYVMTMGEDIYNPDKSLQFYKNLEGRFAPTPADIGSLTQAQMFLDGKIGLYLSGRWMYPKISEKADFDWDVITFPGIVPLDASGWAISADSKHKEQAKKFVNYLSSPKSSEYFLNTGLVVPARIETSQKIDNKVFLDAIAGARAIQVDKDYRKTIDKMNKQFYSSME